MTEDDRAERERLVYDIKNFLAAHEWYRNPEREKTADDDAKLAQCRTLAVKARQILLDKFKQQPTFDPDEL